MYCNRCGKEMASGQQFCASCGAQVANAGVLTAGGRVQRHIQLVSILWFVYSFFALLPGVFLWIFSNFLALHLGRPGDFQDVPPFVPGLLTFLGVLFLAKALAGFAAGWGLLQRERWARPLALVLAFLSLLNVPFGTALGIYTLWVLLPGSAEEEYGVLAEPARQ